MAQPRSRGSNLRRPCCEPVPAVDGSATTHLLEAGNRERLPRAEGRLGPSWGALALLGPKSCASAGSRRSPESIWSQSILGDFGLEL